MNMQNFKLVYFYISVQKRSRRTVKSLDHIQVLKGSGFSTQIIVRARYMNEINSIYVHLVYKLSSIRDDNAFFFYEYFIVCMCCI